MRLTSQNRWKYATIGLMAVLAVGFSFPQASAHITNSVSHTIGHVMDAIAALQSDVDDIKEKTDNLPSDPASESAVGTVHSIVIEERHIDPVDGDQETLFILPLATGKTYSGHMTMTVFGLGNTDSFNSIIISCQTSGTTFASYLYDSAGVQEIEYDFSCISLDITVIDNSGGTDATELEINSVIQYVESSDVTVITDPA